MYSADLVVLRTVGWFQIAGFLCRADPTGSAQLAATHGESRIPHVEPTKTQQCELNCKDIVTVHSLTLSLDG